MRCGKASLNFSKFLNSKLHESIRDPARVPIILRVNPPTPRHQCWRLPLGLSSGRRLRIDYLPLGKNCRLSPPAIINRSIIVWTREIFPFVLSLSKHERLNPAPFDRLEKECKECKSLTWNPICRIETKSGSYHSIGIGSWSKSRASRLWFSTSPASTSSSPIYIPTICSDGCRALL